MEEEKDLPESEAGGSSSCRPISAREVPEAAEDPEVLFRDICRHLGSSSTWGIERPLTTHDKVCTGFVQPQLPVFEKFVKEGNFEKNTLSHMQEGKRILQIHLEPHNYLSPKTVDVLVTRRPPSENLSSLAERIGEKKTALLKRRLQLIQRSRLPRYIGRYLVAKQMTFPYPFEDAEDGAEGSSLFVDQGSFPMAEESVRSPRIIDLDLPSEISFRVRPLAPSDSSVEATITTVLSAPRSTAADVQAIAERYPPSPLAPPPRSESPFSRGVPSPRSPKVSDAGYPPPQEPLPLNSNSPRNDLSPPLIAPSFSPRVRSPRLFADSSSPNARSPPLLESPLSPIEITLPTTDSGVSLADARSSSLHPDAPEQEEGEGADSASTLASTETEDAGRETEAPLSVRPPSCVALVIPGRTLKLPGDHHTFEGVAEPTLQTVPDIEFDFKALDAELNDLGFLSDSRGVSPRVPGHPSGAWSPSSTPQPTHGRMASPRDDSVTQLEGSEGSRSSSDSTDRLESARAAKKAENGPSSHQSILRSTGHMRASPSSMGQRPNSAAFKPRTPSGLKSRPSQMALSHESKAALSPKSSYVYHPLAKNKQTSVSRISKSSLSRSQLNRGLMSRASLSGASKVLSKKKLLTPEEKETMRSNCLRRLMDMMADRSSLCRNKLKEIRESYLRAFAQKSEVIRSNTTELEHNIMTLTEKRSNTLREIYSMESEIEALAQTRQMIEKSRESLLDQLQTKQLMHKNLVSTLDKMGPRYQSRKLICERTEGAYTALTTEIEDLEYRISSFSYESLTIVQHSILLKHNVNLIFRMYDSFLCNLDCPSCFQQLTDTRFLWPCGHVLCRRCLKKLMKETSCTICTRDGAEDKENVIVHCPMCNICVKANHRPCVELDQASVSFGLKKKAIFQGRKVLNDLIVLAIKNIKRAIRLHGRKTRARRHAEELIRPQMSSSVGFNKGSMSSVSKSYRKAPLSTASRSKAHASKLSASSSKRKGAGTANQQVIPRIIVNDKDLTPKSLLPVAKGKEVLVPQNRNASVKSNGSGRETNAGTTPSAAESSGQVTGDPFMSAWSQSEIAMKDEHSGAGGLGMGPSDSTHDSMDKDSEDDLTDDLEYPAQKSVAVETDAAMDAETAPPETADPREFLSIRLVESGTSILFYRIGSSVSTDDPISTSVQTINDAYQKLKSDKANSDIFTSHHSQTDGFPTKTVKIGVAPPTTKEVAVQASNWDIYDAFRDDDEEVGDEEVLGQKKTPELQTVIQREVQENISSILASGGCLLKVNTNKVSPSEVPPEDNTDGKEALQAIKRDQILSSKSLNKSLSIAESLLEQSLLFPKHLLYRDANSWSFVPPAPPSVDEGEEAVPALPIAHNSLEKLWTFSVPEVTGADIVEMKWNPLFPDILVVGYGQIEFTVKKPGFVLFWSIKNPTYPLKQYHLPMGVSSLDFSKTRPHLLAVATYTGSIRIYDVRLDSCEPVLTNTDLNGKHSEAIWKIKWVFMDQEKGEVLISISSDGKVKEWSMKRGLTSRDLMTLKRVPNPNGCSWRPKESSVSHVHALISSQGESLLSRISGGSTFDFANSDSSTYIVGTENGTIHKCSCSYNEQYLQTYVGHSAPVYELQYNPYDENIFISCSSDSTIKVWDMKQPLPLLSIQSPETSQAIFHVAWNPSSSTVFASCTKEGRIEIWDLSASTLNPIITDYAPYKTIDLSNINDTRRHAFMKVAFGQTSPILAAGDENGTVYVYRIHSSIGEFTREKQLDRLNKATHPDAVQLH